PGDQVQVHRFLGGHLAVGLVVDQRDTIVCVSRWQLRQWGVDEDEAFELARDNLRRISSEPFVALAPGIWGSPWDDDYEAARLATPDVIERLPLRGNPVAFAPNWRRLLVTGSEDDAGITAMPVLFEKLRKRHRFLGSLAFCLQDSEWQPFLP